MALHPDDQHDAFESLIKALNYKIEEHYDSWRPGLSQSSDIDINIYYPLVIFEGELYSGTLDQGHLVLNKADYIHFSKEFYIPKPDYIQTVHFDIINENYLPEYIKMIESEVSKLKNSLRSQKQKVIVAINKITEDAKSLKRKTKSYRDLLEF